MAVFREYPGEPVPERYNQSGFTEARDSEWQWHQLGHMQACTSLQTDNHASTPPLSFLQAGCPSCCTTNSVKRLTCIMAVKWSLVGWYMTLAVCCVHTCCCPPEIQNVYITF